MARARAAVHTPIGTRAEEEMTVVGSFVSLGALAAASAAARAAARAAVRHVVGAAPPVRRVHVHEVEVGAAIDIEPTERVMPERGGHQRSSEVVRGNQMEPTERVMPERAIAALGERELLRRADAALVAVDDVDRRTYESM